MIGPILLATITLLYVLAALYDLKKAREYATAHPYGTMYLLLTMQGDDFYPVFAEDELGYKFGKTIEPGEIGKKGRYKGKPSPFGYAQMDIQIDPMLPRILPEDISSLISPELLTTVRGAGATNIALHADVYFTNLSFSTEELSDLAEMGITLNISCYGTKHTPMFKFLRPFS